MATSDEIFLGFDVGTQSTKGVAIDVGRGEVVARAGEAYGLIEGLPEGAAEQHPGTWVEALQQVSHRLLEFDEVTPERVGGVGISGQQHGLVVLDGNDEVVRPAKLWCDTSTAEEAEELSRTFGHAVPTGFTASKIRWMQKHEPENWARVQRVLLPHDYINYVLTGHATMEAGDASGMGFFDPASRSFRTDDLEALDPKMHELLPPLIREGEPAGHVNEKGAALLGIPPGVVVASGGGDNMMSAIGSGATRPGIVVASLGTSGTAFTWSDQPVIDPDGLIAPFCASTGGWLPLLCVMNMTGVTEEIKETFSGASDEDLTGAAEKVPAGCDGLLLVPYLTGERVPDLPRATGALVGIRPAHLRPGVLYRAAIEGTTLSFGNGVDRMRNLGVDVASVRVVGGGSRNPLWRQILSNVLEVPVSQLVETESAALGGAIQALWTRRLVDGSEVDADSVAGNFVKVRDQIVEPDPDTFEVYREARKRLGEVTSRLFG